MTGSRAKMKKRRSERMLFPFIPKPICPKCGQPGLHFVPPSFGDPGFYVCDDIKREK